MTDRIADPADVLDERLRSIIALASDARADMGRRPAALEHAADTLDDIENDLRVAVQCASQMLMDAEDAIAPCASCGDRCAPRPDGSCPACMNAEHEPIDAEKGGR